MTINEKKQLSEYIKSLVRESISEMPLPKGFNYMDELPDEMPKSTEGEFPWPEKEDLKPFGGEMENPRRHYEGPDVDGNNDPVYADKPDDDEPAGLNELRRLAESYARESVAQILSEKKGGWKNKGKKKRKKSEKGEKKRSSSEKTLMKRLNSDSVNAAHYFYKLYGVENGTEAEKASARSKGYKRANAKPTPDKKHHYRFSSKEQNKLNAMMTNDKN